MHTKEPWYALGGSRDVLPMIYAKDENGEGDLIVESVCEPNAESNAARIVACVNGCAGLNPAAIRRLVEAAEAYVKHCEESDVAFGEPHSKKHVELVVRELSLFDTLAAAVADVKET